MRRALLICVSMGAGVSILAALAWADSLASLELSLALETVSSEQAHELDRALPSAVQRTAEGTRIALRHKAPTRSAPAAAPKPAAQPTPLAIPEPNLDDVRKPTAPAKRQAAPKTRLLPSLRAAQKPPLMPQPRAMGKGAPTPPSAARPEPLIPPASKALDGPLMRDAKRALGKERDKRHFTKKGERRSPPRAGSGATDRRLFVQPNERKKVDHRRPGRPPKGARPPRGHPPKRPPGSHDPSAPPPPPPPPPPR